MLPRSISPLITLLTVALVLSPAARGAQDAARRPLRFRVTLAKEAVREGAAGRLLVFMSAAAQKRETLGAGFIPGETWVAAREVAHLAPGETVELDPDTIAYPRAFSRAPAGTYQFMALLDRDHSHAYTSRNPGDLLGPVVHAPDLNPADATPVSLALDRVVQPQRPLADSETVRLVEFRSTALGAFWGRPITMRAGLVLPPSYCGDAGRRYPVVYHVHGFGDDHSEAWRVGPALARMMGERKRAEMVHVFLDGSFTSGHHVFADSVNNGPWGRALTSEFIPHLEGRFRLESRSGARLLTGHSSGGWSTLWLQVNYPDVFGSCWSTSPDPVDFRSFSGMDVTPGSRDNAYRAAEGKPRYLVRFGGEDIVTVEQFARHEAVLGDYGGQLASFEWVFSPRGPDGRPLQLFSRETGALNADALSAWQAYDIRALLEKLWARLGPKLRGKLHVFCGAEDNFRLEESTRLLRDFLKSAGSDAVVEIIPGRDHFTLYRPHPSYPDGLEVRIDREMAAAHARRAFAVPSSGLPGASRNATRQSRRTLSVAYSALPAIRSTRNRVP